MKKLISLTIFITVLFLTPPPISVAIAASPINNAKKTIKDLSAADITSLDRKAIEKKIGRKLKLKEKVALKIIKRKLKKHPQSIPKRQKRMDWRSQDLYLEYLACYYPGWEY